eukprot:CAMPEP_0115149660 /NCGR_PEP_ID=MMETSP0227-20121206/64586_1 /TAXON_ID=89957 /ORGANISM="Polarella glacialis, Strain CCMP 1383" /LENGTH=77 /DNA_ID=CAMNT_0002559897 /DNA_START=21 /DNA_END=251 /DNA_ORIENTATION=+
MSPPFMPGKELKPTATQPVVSPATPNRAVAATLSTAQYRTCLPPKELTLLVYADTSKGRVKLAAAGTARRKYTAAKL